MNEYRLEKRISRLENMIRKSKQVTENYERNAIREAVKDLKSCSNKVSELLRYETHESGEDDYVVSLLKELNEKLKSDIELMDEIHNLIEPF